MNMKIYLDEASRRELVFKSRTQSKDRFDRRLNYSISNFRGLDLKQFFENDYFVFTTPINSYKVTVAFPGAFSELKKAVKNLTLDKVNLQLIIRVLLKAFDMTDDLKVDCTCPDYRYRFKYYASKNGFQYGPPETRPSDITNPNDNIGAVCKHLSRILSNKQWIRKAATVLTQFIRTYPGKSVYYLWGDQNTRTNPLQNRKEQDTDIDIETGIEDTEENSELNDVENNVEGGDV